MLSWLFLAHGWRGAERGSWGFQGSVSMLGVTQVFGRRLVIDGAGLKSLVWGGLAVSAIGFGLATLALRRLPDAHSSRALTVAAWVCAVAVTAVVGGVFGNCLWCSGALRGP